MSEFEEHLRAMIEESHRLLDQFIQDNERLDNQYRSGSVSGFISDELAREAPETVEPSEDRGQGVSNDSGAASVETGQSAGEEDSGSVDAGRDGV